MTPPTLPGGPTQDEVMAVALFKLGLHAGDHMLDIGCGTGKVSIAAARAVSKVSAIDRRQEAIEFARDGATKAGVHNIEFFCGEAVDFLSADRVFDCAFVGGTKQLTDVLPLLVKKVKRTIVVNAVMVSTLYKTVATMQELGVFCEAVQVQVARSHQIAGSIMFRPIDPVYVIVGKGLAC